MDVGRKQIARIQTALRELEIPAWLFYDFRKLDPIACNILKFEPEHHATRRWFYLVPAEGEPAKLVHRIESSMLDHLPGPKHVYLRWSELHSQLRTILQSTPSVAMQYSEMNAIPYLSRVDAGTVELVWSCGASVLSSADLIQHFEAVLDSRQLELHRESSQQITSIVKEAYEFAEAEIRGSGHTSEYSVQQFIMSRLEEAGLVTDSPPIVAVNQNSADPHYQPNADVSDQIARGDFLLIDLWAKSSSEAAVYADITWNAYFGETPPEQIIQVFDLVRQARDRGVEFLRERLTQNQSSQGWEVDDAVREVIRAGGCEDAFIHRTGHNLGVEPHGNGVNFDNLETHDERGVIPGLLCTIEPGIYLDQFGVRSEINVSIAKNEVEVTTTPQDRIVCLPC